MSQNLVIEFSAPGKTILSGEHSVVYSKNALAMAIDLRTHVKIQINNKEQTQNAMKIEFKDENIIYDFKIEEVQNILNELDQQNLKEIMTFTSFQNLINIKPNQLIDIENLKEKQKNSKEIFAYILLVVLRYHYQQVISLKGKQKSLSLAQYKENILKCMQKYQLNILSISKLPISKGLGSSASFNVALSASLFNMIDFLSEEQLKIDQQNFQNFQDLVNKISFDLEKIYHGNPSGIDNYIATYGGLVIFNRAKQQHEGIQTFNLPYKIYLIDSLVEKNTKKAVEKVSEIYHQENLKDIGQPAIQLIEHCTNKIIQILKDQSQQQQDEDIKKTEQIYYQFENLINMNQCLLKMFCLSNYQIEQINMISMKYNIPSKITGAGQGGYCLAFVPKKIKEEEEQQFLKEIMQNGFTYMRADCASQGLKDDSK